MTDNHLEHPDKPEPPEWYYRLWVYLEEEQPPEPVTKAIQQAMKAWVHQMNQEYDSGFEPAEEYLPDVYCGGPEHYPHGKEWTGCDACDHAGDIAFDAARENRI